MSAGQKPDTQLSEEIDALRQLFEITSQIRRSVDVQSILKTTVKELGKAIGVRKASIEIDPQVIATQPVDERVQENWNATL